MFVVRFHNIVSRLSAEISTENMPPAKKLKTSKSKEKKRAPSPTPEPERDLGPNWRENFLSVPNMFNYAFEKGILADVTFVVGEDSFVCRAHRVILAMGSPVFEAMFYGSLAEKGDTITIPDVHPDGFQNLLRYLYTGRITFKNEVVAFKTYFAADKYCVSQLKSLCEDYLRCCKIVPSNVWIFLESSLFLNSNAIMNLCFRFLKHNTEAALQHSSFLDVSPKTVEIVLGLDSLSVSEARLLQNVVRYAKHYKSNSREEDTSQDILFPLLRLIRFGALTAIEFIFFLETCKSDEVFIKESDSFAILKHLVLPTVCSLPDWCCTKTFRHHINGSDSDDSHDSDAQKKISSSSSSSSSSSTSVSDYDPSDIDSEDEGNDNFRTSSLEDENTVRLSTSDDEIISD